MREGLLELFRDTASSLSFDSARASAGTRTQSTDGHVFTPSRYLARYLAERGRPADMAGTGLDELDEHLGGGFVPGLHLIAGRGGVGKTAFLESVAWQAFSTKRPVIYYALKDGSQPVWMRLVGTLGALLDRPCVSASTLASRDLDSRELATLRSLDGELQRSVLSLLSLVDEPPMTDDPWTGLLEDLIRSVRRAEERHGKVPLVLVDDLDQLLLLTGPRPLTAMLSHLDRTLAGASAPGLLSLARSGNSLAGIAALPSKTAIILSPSALTGRQRAGVALRHVDLSLELAARRCHVTLPLVLDPRTGLFAIRPERQLRETPFTGLVREP